MRTKLTLVLVLAGVAGLVVVTARPAPAHHAFSAEFLHSQNVGQEDDRVRTFPNRQRPQKATKNHALEKELATFERKLPELKGEHEGKYVLIGGDEIVDFFSAYDDAIKAGYSRFGLEPFLVKQIQSMEQAQFISRFVEPLGKELSR